MKRHLLEQGAYMKTRQIVHKKFQSFVFFSISYQLIATLSYIVLYIAELLLYFILSLFPYLFHVCYYICTLIYHVFLLFH